MERTSKTRQWSEASPVNPRFRSLLSSPFSGKGLLVQVLTYPFALPAIATTPSVALAPTIPTQAASTDIYTPTTEALSAAPTITLASIHQSSEYIPSAPLQPSEQSASTLTPQAALANPPEESTTVDLAFSDDTETVRTPELLVAIAESEESVQTQEFSGVHYLPSPSPLAPLPTLGEGSPDLSPFSRGEKGLGDEGRQESEDPEFSWFSIGGLTQEKSTQTNKPTPKLAFTTQIEQPPKNEPNNLPILLAGPQDLNPGLSEPPEPLPSQIPSNNDSTDLNDLPLNNPTASPAPPNNDFPAQPIPVEPFTPDPPEAPNENRPFLDWNDLEVGINSDFNNFGESSWSVLPAISGQLANGNTVGLASGFSQFDQSDFESVTHIPVTLSWQGKAGDVTLKASGGIDLFNRLPADTHAGFTAAIPLGEKANVSVSVEQGPFLFNAQTIENQVSRWQYGPDFYWEISPKITLFSKLRFGNYSDGNSEQQSFSRLERKIGEDATVALNLTNQSFQENVEQTSGYFSPQDFLVAAAEMAWQEKITDGLSCGLSGSIGQQRLAGEWALAYNAQALCSVDIASALQIDLGYRFSNVSKDQSALAEDSAFSNQQIIGGIRVRF